MFLRTAILASLLVASTQARLQGRANAKEETHPEPLTKRPSTKLDWRRQLKDDDLSQRIIGGVGAGANEFPFFAHSEGGCGGTLIAPDIVMTADHCSSVFPSNSMVHIGAAKYDGEDSIDSIRVDRRAIHPSKLPWCTCF